MLHAFRFHPCKCMLSSSYKDEEIIQYINDVVAGAVA